MIGRSKPILTVASLFVSILFFESTAYAAEDSEYGDLKAAFRTFYFDDDKEEDIPDSIAFSQAVRLRYNSPYVSDIVNLNASFFGNLKLHGETGEGGTGLLRDNDDGSQSSYAKLGEIFAKFKLPNSGGFSIGRLQLATPLLNDSDNRATPSTTQAGILNINTKGPDFYGLASDRGSAKTESVFGKYTDSNGDNFNIYVLGTDHEFNNALYLHGAIGHAENVLEQIYLNAKYPWHLNDEYTVLIDGYQYFGDADGDGALSGVGPDYSSDITNLVAQVSRSNAKFSLSYQKVRGDDYQFSWDDGVHDDNDLKTWQVVQQLKFNRGGEESWQIRFDYNFKGYIEGLTAMVRYTSGDDIERSDGTTGSEWENNIDVTYSPPQIENLTFRWRHSIVRSSETDDSNENRLIVSYAVLAF